jgi:hypothetical protein
MTKMMLPPRVPLRVLMRVLLDPLDIGCGREKEQRDEQHCGRHHLGCAWTRYYVERARWEATQQRAVASSEHRYMQI